MQTIIRPSQRGDLGTILSLWQESGSMTDGLSVDQAVDLVNSDSAVTLVAEDQGRIVGSALGSASGVIGWIYKLTVVPDTRGHVTAQLLDHLEARLAEQGARRLFTLVRREERTAGHLEERGYEVTPGLVCLEREVPSTLSTPTTLADVGGQLVEPGLWDRLEGLAEVKSVIERRVILPLAEPDLATRHAVSPPKAILLFGPPGTGKTSFARAVASRLAWPFVEIQPRDLAGQGPEQEATLLAQSFESVGRLPSAVVFVDEVEDLASTRQEQRKVRPSVTNEFLKQIPRIRDAAHHLLVCATNFVGTLDPALLRPGRFNCILPIGAPDTTARAAIWRALANDITDRDVDIHALVEASEMFTAADIEFAARVAAQKAFEREHFEGAAERASTDEFLDAIRSTAPTLTEDMIETFQREARKFTRY